MLVLSRKAEESMYIGDDIKITVLDIRGGQASDIGSWHHKMSKFIEKKYTIVSQVKIR